MLLQPLSSLRTLITNLSLRSLTLDFGKGAIDNDLPGASTAAPNVGFGGLVAQVLNIALVIGVVAVFYFFILGGIEWITAGGESAKIQKARDKITQAVIGLVVLVSIVAIMMFIQQLLDICIIEFGTCT